jgi:hypothetical protein
MKILKTYEGFLNKDIIIRPMTDADVRTCMDIYFTIELYDGTIDKYPTTEHLAFYETNKKSAADYIEELAETGKSLEEIQGDELLSGFDPEEIKEITQYLNLF